MRFNEGKARLRVNEGEGERWVSSKNRNTRIDLNQFRVELIEIN